jgi:hypothetical protein
MFRKTIVPLSARRARPVLERLESREVPALLFQNGEWVTGVGIGAGGANVSEVESGFATYGFTANPAFHVADDFTVPSTVMGWNIARIKVYAYQHLAPANENTFTKLHVKIYSGNPATGAPVKLDCTGANAIDVTNSNVFSNTYRVASGDLLDDERAIKEIAANLCAPKRFIPGTYWLEWAAEGSTAYAPPRANVTNSWDPTDNGQKLAVSSGTWSPMIDPVEQGGSGNVHDIPFEIHGRVAPLVPPIPQPRDSVSHQVVADHPVIEDAVRPITPSEPTASGTQAPESTSPQMVRTRIAAGDLLEATLGQKEALFGF